MKKVKAVAQKFGKLPAKPAPQHKPLHGNVAAPRNAKTK